MLVILDILTRYIVSCILCVTSMMIVSCMLVVGMGGIRCSGEEGQNSCILFVDCMDNRPGSFDWRRAVFPNLTRQKDL